MKSECYNGVTDDELSNFIREAWDRSDAFSNMALKIALVLNAIRSKKKSESHLDCAEVQN